MKNIKLAKTTFILQAIRTITSYSLLHLINLYQKYLSPFLGKNCKHYPSCSEYSKQSIQKHGILKGFILTSARIIRCNPWSLGGFDPVPTNIIYKKISSFKLLGNYQTQLYQTKQYKQNEN